MKIKSPGFKRPLFVHAIDYESSFKNHYIGNGVSHFVQPSNLSLYNSLKWNISFLSHAYVIIPHFWIFFLNIGDVTNLPEFAFLFAYTGGKFEPGKSEVQREPSQGEGRHDGQQHPERPQPRPVQHKGALLWLLSPTITMMNLLWIYHI